MCPLGVDNSLIFFHSYVDVEWVIKSRRKTMANTLTFFSEHPTERNYGMAKKNRPLSQLTASGLSEEVPTNQFDGRGIEDSLCPF